MLPCESQVEYDDQLIIKDFIFQFVNNYFVLFYIAYMRQIQVGDIDAECSDGSCLSELQTQVGQATYIARVIHCLCTLCLAN
eukprot:COSAG05_NODE_347_length_10963_cov_157.340943_3_plen_82_part_00